MYFIYIKKDSFLKEKFYRISSVKKDTIINFMKKINVGDILKITLEKGKMNNYKDSFIPVYNKNSFFYTDFFEGKKVNVNYYSGDFIGLYYIRQ